MNDAPHFKDSHYGFEYGAVRVVRAASYKGMVMIGIAKRTLPDYGPFDLTIYVSPTGRSIRVFRGDKELK